MSGTEMKTELEKMLSGEIFDGADQEIDQMRTHALHALSEFNRSIDASQQDRLQANLFGKVGKSIVRAPFHCEFGKTIEIRFVCLFVKPFLYIINGRVLA